MSQYTQALSDWIATATAGLPPSAVDKISAEIADHAAESHKRHLAEGMSPDEADAASIRDLGDASELAVTFRDAHFSRQEYSRGAMLLLVQLVVSLGVAVEMLLSRSIDLMSYEASTRTAINQVILTWSLLNTLSTGILGIFTARAFLTWVREQHDIHVSRWGWRLYVACLLLMVPHGVFNTPLMMAYNLGVIRGEMYQTAPMQIMHHIVDVLFAVGAAGLLTAGVLGIVFSLRRLASVDFRAQPVLGILAVLIGMYGLGLLINNAASLATLNADLPFSFIYSTHYYAVRYTVGMFLSGVHIALMAVALGLFTHMRRPGAIVAR